MQPGRWWRVIAPDGSLWCETSFENEARSNTRPGDKLQRIWTCVESEWRDEDLTSDHESDIVSPMTTDWRDSYSYDDEPLTDNDLFDSDEGICQWLMESYDEDGPCAIPCGRDVEANERRALCGWHAEALDIPDIEFERRIEAGESWCR